MSKIYMYPSRWLYTAWCLLFCLIATAQNTLNTPEESTNSGYAIDVNIFNRYDDHHIDTT